ncbi:BSD domain protein [Aspergillus violaceofuscus CBS 115571]|uniref:BSD domain protein n=1 Tax=Aspergillus violaceofuscus (strain CBS 115571) TaxID=1450538 RepID=A0A2V5IFL4_ASPV1|nr:BSD domain protein [Aspergillus violaceofuscus CBS 115571]
MDVAYDHIQEEIFSSNDASKKETDPNEPAQTDRSNVDLNAELQETFRAFSASPWGARIGGLWDNVRKQGESYYEGARQEYAAASEEAAKGLSDLRSSLVGRTRGLSLSTAFSSGASTSKDETSTPTGTASKVETDASSTAGEKSRDAGGAADAASKPDEGFLSRFKAEAARRLKEIEKAEEAADEAILRFGMNIGQKLREAVSIVPPSSEGSGEKPLFESKDAEGKRVIHATRFEAQLHVIHSTLESFSSDPVSELWPAFKQEFMVAEKTEAIAADLEKYPELRAAMEKLVPEKVEYATFWCRYYFLRLVIETEEQKRKELLQGATVDDEEVKWDDDSDEETDSPSTPQVKSNTTAAIPTTPQTATPVPAAAAAAAAATTVTAAAAAPAKTANPTEPRRSNDQQSQPDSESSYDLVSGATSRTPASPKEKPKDDDSDDDWE